MANIFKQFPSCNLIFVDILTSSMVLQALYWTLCIALNGPDGTQDHNSGDSKNSWQSG